MTTRPVDNSDKPLDFIKSKIMHACMVTSEWMKTHYKEIFFWASIVFCIINNQLTFAIGALSAFLIPWDTTSKSNPKKLISETNLAFSVIGSICNIFNIILKGRNRIIYIGTSLIGWAFVNVTYELFKNLDSK
jgi:hypothetical protein